LMEVSFIAKGISFDSISPSWYKPYGVISGDNIDRWRLVEPQQADWVLTDWPLLSLLSIHAVVASTNEHVTNPYLKLERILTNQRGVAPIAIYQNTRAFPIAISVPSQILDAVPPRRPNCKYRVLVCLDLSLVATQAITDGIQTTLSTDEIMLQSNNGELPKSILLSVMYRPEWTLEPEAGLIKEWNGLIRVEPRPRTSTLTLRYRPWVRIFLTIVELLSASICLVLFVFCGKREVVFETRHGT